MCLVNLMLNNQLKKWKGERMEGEKMAKAGQLVNS